MIGNHFYTLYSKRQSKFGLSFLISVILFIGFGCSSTKNIEPINDTKVDYSLIFVVHGDASYLYHENGNAKQADEEALNQSIEIAEIAERGEVFIFHQKPERKAFLFFPKKDRVYYHYKNGLLISKEAYSPEDGGFTKESEIYKQLTLNRNKQQTYFTYFGHEIPTLQGRAYHRSSSKLSFDTEIFADHLHKFSSDFALTILSTCNNGNPLMLEYLKDLTDIVVASPQNLHLSYLKTEKFNLLESEPEINSKSLADSIALDSFSQLSSLQTMVTVGVYSIEGVSGYITSLSQNYQQHLNSVEAKPLFTNNADCKTIDGLNSSLGSTGIDLLYKPASFGRKADDTSHSGWGCKD